MCVGHQAVLSADYSQACCAETSLKWKHKNRGEEDEKEEPPLFRRGSEKEERDRQGMR